MITIGLVSVLGRGIPPEKYVAKVFGPERILGFWSECGTGYTNRDQNSSYSCAGSRKIGEPNRLWNWLFVCLSSFSDVCLVPLFCWRYQPIATKFSHMVRTISAMNEFEFHDRSSITGCYSWLTEKQIIFSIFAILRA